MGEVNYEDTLTSNQPNYKEKSILELRKNLSKDTYANTVYLSDTNFVKTSENVLRKSRNSR